ncbi:MAG: sigma-70 family RNA polymerase sigma factor [Planctomycetota bacterium]
MLAEPVPIADSQSRRSRRQELFLDLLAEITADLEGYVRSLVLDRNDSDDVLQEVCVTLWGKFEEFEFGTSFRKWAFSIAFHKCRSFWRDRQRYRGVVLSDAALSKLSLLHEASREIDEIENRLLDECLKRLGTSDRKFVRRIYFEQAAVAAVAKDEGTTSNAVYLKLSRLRKKLARCLDRRLT